MEMRWKLKFIEASLRPTLMYIPRGLENYTDHGCGHSERIIAFIDDILPKLQGRARLNTSEEFLLRALAWTHDIGCIVRRADHADRSARILEKHFRDINGIGEYIPLLAPLSKAHSDDGKPENRIMALPETPIPFDREMVRLRYLAALFRLFDACDVTYERGPRMVMKILRDDMSPKDLRYWKAHDGIIGVKIDPEAGKIILSAEDKGRIGIVLTDIKRNLKRIRTVLMTHGWKDLKIESISIQKDEKEIGH